MRFTRFSQLLIVAMITALAASNAQGEAVELGAPELTAGIPGQGPLTVGEIKVWLDDSKNHEPIDPMLPLGMSAASLPLPSNTGNSQ